MNIPKTNLTQTVDRWRRKAVIAVFIITTGYILLLNSYALFAVYPALKTHTVAVPFLVYFFLCSPVLLYGLIKSKPKRPQWPMVMGLLVLVVAMVFQLTQQVPLAVLLGTSIVYVLTAYVEETLWRGLLWRMIQAGGATTRRTYVLVTVHFAALHLPFAFARAENPAIFFGTVLVLGAVLGGLRILGRGVTLPTFVHAAINIVAKT